MYQSTFIGLFSLVAAVGIANADVPGPGPGLPPGHDDGHGDCHGPICKPPTKEICFNLLCLYGDKDEDHGGPGNRDPHEGEGKKCRAAATFNARVTLDGGEVQSDSDFDDKVQLELKCGDKPEYNGGARRLTDLLGTRIQGDAGPFPAITLPRGALHTGAAGQSGDHVTRSVLEFDMGEISKLPGKCFIWTGAP